MTKLVLSPSNSRLLRRLGKESKSNHHAVQSLKKALDDQPEQAKMTVQSPAVPTASSTEAVLPLIVDHTILLSIASWAQGQEAVDVDQAKLKLSSLVAGSHVYIPPKPVFQRSKELDESLTAIRRAQEEAEYQRISTTLPTTSYKIPSSYVNISGVDPTLSLSQRISSHTQSPLHHTSNSTTTTSRALLGQGEEQAWKEAQQTLSVILNIFLSTFATATAAWWASGNVNVGHKVLVSMLVAVVTAVAEVVLYNRYSVYVGESKRIKTSRMKGSDLHKTGVDFKPLQLDRGTPKLQERTKTSTLNKDPS